MKLILYSELKKETPMPAGDPLPVDIDIDKAIVDYSRTLSSAAGGSAVSSSNSHAMLCAELVRTRAALRDLYRVTVLLEGPITHPSKQPAIREAAEVIGLR